MKDESKCIFRNNISELFNVEDIFQLLLNLISSFEENRNRMSPITHFEIWFNKKQSKNENLIQLQSLLSNILYGMERRRLLIKDICKLFYCERKGKLVNRDSTIYSLLIFLTLFCAIQKISFESLQKLFSNNAPAIASKNVTLLKWIYFDFKEKEENENDSSYNIIHPSIVNILTSNLDAIYVQSNILQPLSIIRHKFSKLVSDLSRKHMLCDSVLETKTIKCKTLNTTKTQPFNLTKMLPRNMKLKQKIDMISIDANPKYYREVPRSTYDTSLVDINQEMQHKKRLSIERTKNKYLEIQKNNKNKFYVRQQSGIKSYEVLKDRMELFSFTEQFKAKEVPNFHKNAIPIRMTTSAILREDNLFVKEQESLAKQLKEYECTLHDSHQFDEWKERELLEMEIVEQRRIHDRKMEMQKSGLMAKHAVQEKITENKNAAFDMNAMKEIALQEKREIERLELQKRKTRALEIKKECAENVRISIGERMQEKRNMVKEITDEQNENEEYLKQERKAILEEKRTLIQQIKQREKERMTDEMKMKRKKEKESLLQENRTTCAQIGLLCEMSLNELKTIKCKMNALHTKEHDIKRERISNDKKEKQTLLRMKVRNLSKMRNHRIEVQRKERMKKQRKKEIMDREKEIANEEKVVQMANFLKMAKEKKTIEMQKNAMEIAMITKKRKEWKENSELVQKMRWVNYNSAIERSVKERQEKDAREAQKKWQIEDKERQRRRRNLAIKQASKQNIILSVNEALMSAKIESKKLKEIEKERKQMQYKHIRKSKQMARMTFLQRKPFEKEMEINQKMKAGKVIEKTKKNFVQNVTIKC